MNQKYDQLLEKISLEFLERYPSYKNIISICHTDADGIASSILIKYILEKKGNFSQIFFDLSIPWEEFLPKIKINNNARTAFDLSDLCCSMLELIKLYETHPFLDIYILDHHLYDHQKLVKYSDRIFNANPTQCNLHGLKEIVGATVNYLFCKNVNGNVSKIAWIAAIGISGDTLQHLNQMQSYNRAVIDEAHNLSQIEIKEGLCLFGGQFERIDRALSQSLLPFIPQIMGSRDLAKKILMNLNIDPKTKVEALSEEEIKLIINEFGMPSLRGEYLVMPNKKGILRYGFEHAQAISIVGHDHPSQAIQLIGGPRITQDAKTQYLEYTEKIIKNLSTFLNITKIETNYAIIADLSGKIHKSEWSDTGSLASINELYNINKILIIGGKIDTDYKFSLRCTPHFIKNHHGQGVNIIIKEISNLLGAKGGGHGLAGGLRMNPSKFTDLIQEIDRIIENL